MDETQKEYDNFRSVCGESLSDHITRFMNLLTKMKKAGIPVTNRAKIKRLLDSLPKEWSIRCMKIKDDFIRYPTTLTDVVDALKSLEMEVNQIGVTPKASPTTPTNMSFPSPISVGSSSFVSSRILNNLPASSAKTFLSEKEMVEIAKSTTDNGKKVTEEDDKVKQIEKVDAGFSEAGGKNEEKTPFEAQHAESSKEKEEKDLVNSIPHSFKVKLCTSACVDVVAHYKSLNLEFERQKDKALKFNKELKQNEAAYQRKLNSTLAEMQTLKEFVFRKDFIINDLTDRLEKALNEKNKLQIIIDKWNVSQKAITDIKNCQRPTYVKDGIGYKDRQGNERKLFFPPHSKNYVPMPTPHPDNDLIDKNDLIAQNINCENDKISNVSESSEEVIEREEDVCDEDCGGTKIGIGYSGDSYSTVNWFAWNCDKANKTAIRDDCNGNVSKSKANNHNNVVVECFDLNSAICDEKGVCEPPVFVPELKQNRFGKFLTEEIPEFVPSHTSTSESEKELNEESSSEDSITTTSEGGEGSSSEDQGDLDFQSYQEWESSNDSKTPVTDACKTIEDLEPLGVQEPTTSNDTPSPVNQDPLEEHLVIEDCTSSDDESVLNESLGELNIKRTSEVIKPHVSQHAESSSKQSLPLAALHGTAKSQKPFKACFRCGKEGHVLKQCPERHDPDGKDNQYYFSGSKGKNHTSLKDRMKNFQSKSPHVKPVSHDSKMKRTYTSKPQSFPPGLKHKIVSNFKSFTNKIFKPTQVWRVKQVVVKEINEGKDLAYREVYYFDERGQPKTAMAWVPLSN
ncbi:putative transcription factor interactor and regulator CCHC(Zn) family [Helianthus annuus]|nr:putative transcription factor interactor and regulator CCHC(Zn) family [Helianthus annuus]KAJ0506343.1 putative transcription factor interactor and regulator CCHC(Zn) family [Helianthus annuus]KAJ0676019.1 putative transcription factor interactor and regulator CCHC(Zn) family [Helianthus annuus]